MKGRPPGRNSKTTKAITKPKVGQVRKPRNAAASNKKSSSPFSTSGGHSSCDQESVSSDPSETNFPYDIRFNGVSSLLNVIHKATPEVKDLLMDECEIILECRVCRNLFRSFPNFLCHKQQFCKKVYNPATQSKYGPLLQCAENLYQLQYHIDASLAQASYANIETSGPGSIRSKSSQETNSECRNNRLEQILTKMKHQDDVYDGTSKVDERENSAENRIDSKPNKRKSTLPVKAPHQGHNGVISSPRLHQKCLAIEPLLNRAQDGIAFQSWMASEKEIGCDKARSKTKEDTAILGLNGKTIYLGAEEGAEMFLSQVTSEDENICGRDNSLIEFQCILCQTQFCSEKTLRLHTRKSHCNPLERESITNNNAEVLSNKKRLLHLPEESLKTQENRFSPGNSPQLTMNPSPTKSLIKKRRTEMDYKIAKENKNIIRSIFGPKKPSSKTAKPKVPTNETTSTRTDGDNPAQTNVNEKTQMDYSSGHEAQNERRDVPMISSCINCSASFATKSEMSTHLAKCNGVINLAFQRSLLSPERKKICIQIRHHYGKEHATSAASPKLPNEIAQKNVASPLPEQSESSMQNSSSDLKAAAVVQTGHFNNNVNETKPIEIDDTSSDSDSVVLLDYHEPKPFRNEPTLLVNEVSIAKPLRFKNATIRDTIKD